MDWPIQEVARLSGITTRTLRHYDQIGLLPPSRTSSSGLRHYDAPALMRLQRILMLRQLGLGLPAIADVLDGQHNDISALRDHLVWLEAEQERIARQIQAVKHTIITHTEGTTPMAHDMLDGFDHTQYKDEVQQRWGAKAYADSDRWWRGLSTTDKAGFMAETQALAQAWKESFAAGDDPASDAAQQLAGRHVQWLTAAHQGKKPGKEHLIGLARMYVDDPRFAANYEMAPGDGGAIHVRDALIHWAENNCGE
ncbi:MerR family transcriptional regulator [Lolliginicoccus suaedae]|uniref:MerR family transcriptional regulator n=1 Tax=Lolliginicoccus suaedae TaxID=2605429 RepID=UPI0011EE9BF7|nr:MerR family transcriptional regulator [Lolliginicoccus suaedae]